MCDVVENVYKYHKNVLHLIGVNGQNECEESITI